MQVPQTHRSSLTDNADGERSETIIPKFLLDKNYCIVHSLNKYWETEGIKDIGTNFWSQARTNDIKDRYVHLDCHEFVF